MMNIILSGFMGSGKTTVATELANRLHMQFIDIDQFIEQENGMSVSRIFELHGEEGFRKLETEAVKKIGKMDHCVIATGGGTILNSQNVKNLKKSGKIIFLNVSVDTVMLRLQYDGTRPLLNRSDKENSVTQLLMGRLPIYKSAADFSIDANSDDLNQKVDLILRKLNLDK